MKRIFFIILVFAIILFVIFFPRPIKKVWIEGLEGGRFRLNIGKKPYIVKGVVYNPTPIGQNYRYNLYLDSSRPWLYDGKLMKAMGVNTVRFYQSGEDAEKTKQVIRDLYNRYNIRTAMGHWLGFWESPNYADPEFKERVKEDVLWMVQTYKDEKGLLFWILGNENNVSFGFSPQTANLWTTPEIERLGDPYSRRIARAKIYYSFVNELAKEIKRIDKNHPIVLANAELVDIQVANEVTPDVDILGCSVYRGKSFGNFFREVKIKFGKPVIVTEFGCDRFDAYLKKEDEERQAEFLKAQLEDIKKNLYFGSGVGNAIGGFIFEWTDEWWKHDENSPPSWYAHDTEGAWSNGAYYFDIKAELNLNINEEWWGIVGILPEKKEGINIRVPKKAYFVVKESWK